MPKSKVTIVEIGSKNISVLIGSKGLNDSFIIHGYGEQDYAGYYEGEFLEEDKLQETISKAINEAQSSANVIVNKLYVGVPANFSFCKTKTLTQTFGQKVRITEQDIYEMYQKANESEREEDYVLLSCSPITYILDDGRKTCRPIGQKTSKISAELSLVYAEKEFIVKINNLLKNIGITTVEYLSSTLCEGMYLIPEERREETAVLIDCGYIETSVSVIKGDGLVSLKSFAVGSGHISADLSQCLNLTFDEAEQLRKQLILTVVPSDTDEYEISKNGVQTPIKMKDANQITNDRLEMMGALIRKCLTKDNQELPPVPFYLTGGGISYTKGAKDILSNYLGVNLSLLYPKDVHLAKPHYSTVLGLLDKAIKQESKNEGFFKSLIRKIIKK